MSVVVDSLRKIRVRLIAFFRVASTSRAAMAFRSFVPAPVRKLLHRVKKRVHAQPIHLQLPQAGGGAPVRVVVYGTFANDWIPRLANWSTWHNLANVEEVLILPDPALRQIPPPRNSRSRTVLIPLSEDDIISCPGTFPRLAPPPFVIETLRDKVMFAAYVEKMGLTALCPTVYRTPAEVRLPCIVKPARSSYGMGIRILTRQEQIASFVAIEGHSPSAWIWQEFVDGAIEYSTHCVFKEGRLLWSCSFMFEPADGTDIRRGVEFRTMREVTPPQTAIDGIVQLLGPLAYSGPCNVDYKIPTPDRIAIFEINPRFGGSLMIDVNLPKLQEALRCIVEEAV